MKIFIFWYESNGKIGKKTVDFFLISFLLPEISAFSGALWQGSSTENWAKSLKLSRMTAGYFIDTKSGMVTHTVNSNLKPLLFFKKVTWLSIPGVKTIQIWPLNFGSKRQSEGYLQNLWKMALTAWDKVYFSNPTGSFENRYLLFVRGSFILTTVNNKW